MYEAFYGFRERPFNLTPDPRFLYLSAKHNEAFAHLEYGLRQRGGFMVVTGEVGTGKTTLCRYFLDRLDESMVSAFILYPALGTTELLRSINHDLGIPSDAPTEKELIDTLHAFLLESHRKGRSIVIVIDESQNLSRDVLEQVRLVSNLETDTEKLLQIVLIGQSELNEKLAQRDLRQLAQRITARYHLTPLSRQEMTQYIRHRLAVAGGIGRVEFTPGALRAIHRFSKGIPRLINLVCDRALLAGYVLEKSEIGGRIVRRAVKELNLGDERPWYRRLGWKTALLASCLGVAAGLAFAARIGSDSSWRFPPASLLTGLGSAPAESELREESMSAEEVAAHFEARLVTLSEELSRRAATAVLLERWDIHVAGGIAAISALEDMPSLADRAALQYSELETNLAQLKVLNLPAVLEMHHPSRDTIVYVTLTALEGDAAVVYFAPGDFFRVPLEVLHRFWNGRARVFWRDFERLEFADVPSRLAWARSHLRELGLLSSDSGNSPEGLLEAVKALQEKVQLEPTGQVGHETRMALYSLARSYDMPRLYEEP